MKKNKTKNILKAIGVSLLILCLCFTLVGCDNKKPDPGNNFGDPLCVILK